MADVIYAGIYASAGALCAGILSYLFQQFQQPPPGNLLTFVSTYINIIEPITVILSLINSKQKKQLEMHRWNR